MLEKCCRFIEEGADGVCEVCELVGEDYGEGSGGLSVGFLGCCTIEGWHGLAYLWSRGISVNY